MSIHRNPQWNGVDNTVRGRSSIHSSTAIPTEYARETDATASSPCRGVERSGRVDKPNRSIVFGVERSGQTA